MSAWLPSNRLRLALFSGVLLLAALAVLVLVARFRAPEPTLPLADLERLDGLLVHRNDTNRAFTGWVMDRYKDGTLKSRSHVARGRLDGVSEGWHTNGVLQIREHFVAGLSEGAVTRWHPDGAKLSEGTARAGKFEGLFRRWHANGILAEELNLVAGQPHGVSRSWFPSGSPKAEVLLDHGQVVRQRFWKDGELPAVAGLASNPVQP